MTLLAGILQGDRSDLELIQLTLETLANVVTYEVGSEEGESHDLGHRCKYFSSIVVAEQSNLPPDITVQFTGLS